jgi:hypothetical protein
MADPRSPAAGTLALVVRRVIRATPERLFEAWTEPTQILGWWGPEGATCEGAEVDLRVGGRYGSTTRSRREVAVLMGSSRSSSPEPAHVHMACRRLARRPEQVVRFERATGTKSSSPTSGFRTSPSRPAPRGWEVAWTDWPGSSRMTATPA